MTVIRRAQPILFIDIPCDMCRLDSCDMPGDQAFGIIGRPDRMEWDGWEWMELIAVVLTR